MSLLRVHRKAANEADAKKLVEATYRLTDPFGVPTLFLHDRDFSHISFSNPKADQKIKRRIKKAISKAAPCIKKAFDYHGADYRTMLTSEYLLGGSKKVRGENRTAAANCGPIWQRSDDGIWHAFAHTCSPDLYKDPVVAIINMSKENIRDFGYTDYLKINTEVEFFIAWHEIAHANGSDEAHADMTASIMAKRNFKNIDFLKAYSDIRALATINSLQNRSYLTTIPFNCIDSIDYISQVDTGILDSLSEEQIKSLRFLDFQSAKKQTMKAWKAVFNKLSTKVDFDKDAATIDQVSETCAYFLNKWKGRKGTPEYSILQRAHLAATRMFIGLEAYENNDLEQQMWADGYRLHFMPKDVPEFLPDPSSVSPV